MTADDPTCDVPQPQVQGVPEGGEAPIPCPCCGGESSADGVSRYTNRNEVWWPDKTRVTKAFFVNCMGCGLSQSGRISGGYQTREKAIEAWNRRAGPSSEAEPTTDLIAVARQLEAEARGNIEPDAIRRLILTSPVAAAIYNRMRHDHESRSVSQPLPEAAPAAKSSVSMPISEDVHRKEEKLYTSQSPEPRPTMLTSDNGFPRSIRVDLFTDAELAIRNAMIDVEHAGADPLLTDAVILLGDARRKVAEWVDREIVAGRMAMPTPRVVQP